MLKITNETCDLACELLNKAKETGDESFIKALMEATDHPEITEGVGALTQFLMCNIAAFTQMAMVMAPQFAVEKNLPLPVAIIHLQTQLQVRLLLYVANRAHEGQQFENFMSLDEKPEEKEGNNEDQKT